MPKLTKKTVDALSPKAAPYDIRDTDVRGFLVRVEPSGQRSFFLDYRLRGRRSRYRLGIYPNLSVDGARSIAQATAGDIARGIDPQARRKAEREKASRERLSTLKAFLDGRYEPWAQIHLKSASFQLARLRSDFADQMGQPLDTFDGEMVDELRQQWKKDGMKPRSVNRDIQRLQSVLSRAVDWGILERHPLAGLKPLKADKTGRVRFLTPAEETALRSALERRERKLREARERFNKWRAARRKDPLPTREGDFIDHLRPLVLLALNTGLRRGEMLGLQWRDVNLDAKLLTVVAETAKSGHTRRVPLNVEAFAVLTAWHERSGAPSADSFVFPAADGERMKSINNSWPSLMTSAGIKDFRLHDCRHHFASKLVQSGVDLYTVKELLGHSEIAMTERYSHLSPNNLRAAVDRLAS